MLNKILFVFAFVFNTISSNAQYQSRVEYIPYNGTHANSRQYTNDGLPVIEGGEGW